MSVTIKVDIPKAKILKSLGLGGTNKVQKHLASEVNRFSDPYVPMQQRLLKKATIAADGSSITYTQPYAHYHFYGEVMAGRAPKHYTGRKLTYHGAPMRGSQWTQRMLADKSQDIERSVEAYIKKGG